MTYKSIFIRKHIMILQHPSIFDSVLSFFSQWWNPSAGKEKHQECIHQFLSGWMLARLSLHYFSLIKAHLLHLSTVALTGNSTILLCFNKRHRNRRGFQKTAPVSYTILKFRLQSHIDWIKKNRTVSIHEPFPLNKTIAICT